MLLRLLLLMHQLHPTIHTIHHPPSHTRCTHHTRSTHHTHGTSSTHPTTRTRTTSHPTMMTTTQPRLRQPNILRQRTLFTHFIKVWTTLILIHGCLSMCCGQSLHFNVEVVFAPKEEFVVIRISVWTCGDYSTESPVVCVL